VSLNSGSSDPDRLQTNVPRTVLFRGGQAVQYLIDTCYKLLGNRERSTEVISVLNYVINHCAMKAYGGAEILLLQS
jgi:hypothetical protein